jgi:DNA-binding NtrC family response regulator
MAELRAPFRIFVVDDEFIIASTLATILQRNGFDAVYFTDPLEALPLPGQGSRPADYRRCDAGSIWDRSCDCDSRRSIPRIAKVLLFSGQAATSNLLEAARRAKGHDFELLSKPIHPTEFLKKISFVSGRTGRLSGSRKSLRS